VNTVLLDYELQNWDDTCLIDSIRMDLREPKCLVDASECDS
jgi:hypothetical protein